MLLGLVPVLCAVAAHASQLPISSGDLARSRTTQNRYWQLPHEIRDVAVIGAGPNGLLQAATLLEHGFHVRLFERGPRPGGIWAYSEKTPVAPPPM